MGIHSRKRPFPNPDIRAYNPQRPVAPEDFASWGWQLKNRIETLAELDERFRLSPEERTGFRNASRVFRTAITPYYALLADPSDPSCPIRRQVIPSPRETEYAPNELSDPLGEESLEIVPNLVHRYPDRVLLLVADRCPIYCRFCTRRRVVGRTERQAPRALLQEAFAYIEANTEIREVIISGGDALMLADGQLSFILERLRKIPHLDILRLATRMPVACPMRVTDRLVNIVARHAPVYVMTHFNHPKECTEWAFEACSKFINAGVPVYNQSVLLRGINDKLETIAHLNRLLVYMRVTPYYLHQCDLAQGIEHFRTPLASGVAIIEGLRGHMSGLAVPQFCVDVPGGLGKITVQPDWVVGRTARTTTFRTYQGKTAEYPDPSDRVSQTVVQKEIHKNEHGLPTIDRPKALMADRITPAGVSEFDH